MIHRTGRAIRVAVLLAGLLVMAPLASALNTPQHQAVSALDNALTGVSYACPNQLCAIVFHSNPPVWFCKNETNSGEWCSVIGGGTDCDSGACD